MVHVVYAMHVFQIDVKMFTSFLDSVNIDVNGKCILKNILPYLNRHIPWTDHDELFLNIVQQSQTIRTSAEVRKAYVTQLNQLDMNWKTNMEIHVSLWEN